MITSSLAYNAVPAFSHRTGPPTRSPSCRTPSKPKRAPFRTLDVAQTGPSCRKYGTSTTSWDRYVMWAFSQFRVIDGICRSNLVTSKPWIRPQHRRARGRLVSTTTSAPLPRSGKSGCCLKGSTPHLCDDAYCSNMFSVHVECRIPSPPMNTRVRDVPANP